MSIGKNLSKLMAAKGLTLQDVANALLVSRQAVSYWKTGRADPEASKLKDLANYLGVPITDLFEENLKVTVVQEKETPVPSGLAEISEFCFRPSGSEDKSADWKEVIGGSKQWYCIDFFTSMGLKPELCIRCRVKGDSMKPYLFKGDVVLFSIEKNITLNEIEDGEIYAFSYEGGLGIKRLSSQVNSLMIRSDNPAYPTEVIKGAELEKVRIYGRVLEICRVL